MLSLSQQLGAIACLVTLVVTPLRSKAVEPYRLAPGDLMAVIVHGVVGKFGHAPVHFPNENEDFLPAQGYPYLVLHDGKLHLPEIDGIYVAGQTVAEAQQAISKAYMDAKVLSKPHMVALTLMRKRKINVTVLHTNSSLSNPTAEQVSLSADQATLLTAIAEAGPFDRHSIVRILSPKYSRIQTDRQKLTEGAIIELRSPTPAYFYTGGQVAGGEHRLPVDQNLNAIQAIALAGGYYPRGLIPPHKLTVLSRTGPSITLPLSQVLSNPNRYIVRPGDTLILR